MQLPGPMPTEDGQATQLTFVMPVTLKEGSRLGSWTWRASPDKGAALRLRYCLSSLWHRFDQRDLREILLICPADEATELEALVHTVTDDARIRVIPELEICSDIVHCTDPETGSLRGWYVQQLLKMAVAQQVMTPFYMTIDSDAVCIREFCSADLLEDGRGTCGRESRRVYEQIYAPWFAEKEAGTKEARADYAGELLGYQRPARYADRYHSETPLQFHTASMRNLCAYVTERYGQPWTRVLAEREGWTEIYLYFAYLEMVNQLDAVHSMHGPNKVLHLEGSVWHGSNRYSRERPYDAAHFERVLAGDDGLFITVQSWLDESSWLPWTGCATLEEFYAHLGRVLDVDVG